jgi:nitrous oxidase accessory protein NosD
MLPRQKPTITSQYKSRLSNKEGLILKRIKIGIHVNYNNESEFCRKNNTKKKQKGVVYVQFNRCLVLDERSSYPDHTLISVL